MKLFKSKQAIAVGLAAGLTLGLSGVAFSYFTSTGDGTGSATVGSATAWTVAQTGVTSGGPLYPDASIGGANIQTNAYHVQNTGSGSQNLTDVKIKVATSTGAAWTSGTCSASDFSLNGAAVGTEITDTALAGTFTAGQDKTDGSVTIEMIDSGSSQDDCQGVSVPLYFYAS